MTESVIVHSFWSQHHHKRPIVFHSRSERLACSLSGGGRYPCGHAVPRDVAEKIARPCRRCYPEEAS